MTAVDYSQLILFVAILLVTAKPLGIFMEKVFEGQSHFLSPVFGGLERLFIVGPGFDPDEDQHWTRYTGHLLIFSGRDVSFYLFGSAIPKPSAAEPAEAWGREPGSRVSTPR